MTETTTQSTQPVQPTTPQITMYTTATCVYCNAEKQFFKEHNVAFEEVRVDTDAAAADKMIKLSGQMGVPFTVIKLSNKQEEHILGFDQDRLTAVLGL
jgi:glutaredoxin 3